MSTFISPDRNSIPLLILEEIATVLNIKVDGLQEPQLILAISAVLGYNQLTWGETLQIKYKQVLLFIAYV